LTNAAIFHNATEPRRRRKTARRRGAVAFCFVDLKASVTFRDGRAKNKPLFFDWAICRLIGETRRGGVKKRENPARAAATLDFLSASAYNSVVAFSSAFGAAKIGGRDKEKRREFERRIPK
jgi:hypothetical protein